MAEDKILELKNISKFYANIKTDYVNKAVDNVSLSVEKGEIYGLVGESGCGKTTLANIILRLDKENSGQIIIDGTNITDKNFNEMIPIRKKFQAVFQDISSSLDPRMCVEDIVSEPLKNYKMDCSTDIINNLMQSVGLNKKSIRKKPNEFSGGQRQRIAIARAIAIKPELIILDEATSGLDAITANEIINLLQNLSNEYKMAYLFISHDINIVKKFCDKISVMKKGQIVETLYQNKYDNPTHEYTKKLIK